MFDFNFVLLHVADPLESARFYSDLLGLKVVEAEATFAMAPLNEKVLLGWWLAGAADPEGRGSPGASEISFDVADLAALEALHEDWKARDISIHVPPVEMPFGHTFVAANPDGHRIRIVASKQG